MMIPVILGVSFLVYFIMSLTPGFDDPARIMLGMEASDEAVESLNQYFGADKPFFQRYFNYLGGLLRGDFGISYSTQLSISGEIMRRYPTTLRLALFACLLSFCIGVPIGIITAVRQYSLTDYITRVFAMLMTAIPGFWLGIMLILLFGLHLGLLPVSGIATWRGFILPSLSLSIITMGTLIRITRSAMLEVVRQDYIRTARAKGQKEHKIIIHHALKNALIPVITVAGTTFGMLLGGAVITESVFALPGLGTYTLAAIGRRDLPCVLGAAILLAASFSLINLAVDLTYVFIDPRIKSQYASRGRRRRFGK